MNLPNPVTRRSQRRELTRRQLVQAGLRVVAVSGFAGATTAAIAKETGKAHGTVFVHFPTRDALVGELVEEVGRALSDRLAAATSHSMGLSDFFGAHLEALAEHEELYSRLLGEVTTLPMAARARVFALQSGITWRLRSALAHDVALGRARDLEPMAVGNAWIALTNHYLIHRDLFAPGTSVIAARGEDLKSQMLSFLIP